jgi:hypothetical protein
MAIPPERSIVTVDKRPYRKIAQENWGLTDEQMKGMHVHHRIPVSNGGTNDPSNLYVCSPSFHQNVWHNGESWIKWATAGGKKGGPLGGRTCKERGVGIFAEGSHSAAGKIGGPRGAETQKRQRTGLFGLSSGQRSENTKKQWEDPEYRELMKEVAIKSGRNLFVNKLGAHAEENLGKGAKTTNSTLWVDPDHPELGAHHFRRLGKFQREAGLPDGKSHRVKL